MKHVSYKRKPGDFEIRILKDGRVVMVAPDEILAEIAQKLDPKNHIHRYKIEIKENARGHNPRT